MLVMPGATPATTPLDPLASEITATPGFDELQVTWPVASGVSPATDTATSVWSLWPQPARPTEPDSTPRRARIRRFLHSRGVDRVAPAPFALSLSKGEMPSQMSFDSLRSLRTNG